MAELIKAGNTTLGVALACKKEYNPRNIIIAALDGTPYVQTTGQPKSNREVDIYCETKAKRDNTDNAANTGALIDVHWKGEILKGYISGKISWKEWRDEHGVGHFTLLVSEVVSE